MWYERVSKYRSKSITFNDMIALKLARDVTKSRGDMFEHGVKPNTCKSSLQTTAIVFDNEGKLVFIKGLIVR